jgi:CheY-like chemotaxis protein
VIINLAVNAIKFTPEGGSVNIWATAEDGDDVTIGITDSGPGISQENLAIIFDRFQQVDQNLRASTKGFGLGLNIAKELVALNLGRINVESEVGAGSTFAFTVPKYEPRIVLERYLDRITAMGDRAPVVSLLTAEAKYGASQSAEPVADEFLQRSVRANDLVVHVGNGTWVIAAVCAEQECHHLIQRLSAEWANYVRNCPDVQLPQLDVTRHQTNAVAAGRRELVEAYLKLVGGDGSRARPVRRVLVVYDDREVSQCLGVRLRAAGFEVISAYDGEQGVSTALEQQPDAVVLDIRMPKKDGMTVLRELRTYPSLQRTPIVMLSASIRDQHRALEAGASYFVPKPYEATQVLSALESSLREECLT